MHPLTSKKTLEIIDDYVQGDFHVSGRKAEAICSIGDAFYSATGRSLNAWHIDSKSIVSTYESPSRIKNFFTLSAQNKPLIFMITSSGYVVLDSTLNRIAQVELELEGYDYHMISHEQGYLLCDEKNIYHFNLHYEITKVVDRVMANTDESLDYSKFISSKELLHVNRENKKLFICSTEDSSILRVFDTPDIYGIMRGCQVAVSSDGLLLAYYNSDYSEEGRSIDLIDAKTGDIIKRCFTFGFSAEILSLQFTSDNQKILLQTIVRSRTGASTLLSLWDVNSGLCLWNNPYKSDWYMAFSTDNSRIFMNGDSNGIEILDAATGKTLASTGIVGSQIDQLLFDHEQEALYCITESNQNNCILSTKEDKKIKRLNETPFITDSNGLVYLDQWRYISRLDHQIDQTTLVYNLPTNEVLHFGNVEMTAKALGQQYMVMCWGSQHYVYTIRGNRLYSIEEDKKILSLLFTHQDKYLLVVDHKDLRVHLAINGELVKVISREKVISGIRLCPNHSHVFFWDNGKNIHCLNLETLELEYTTKSKSKITDILFDVKGEWVIMATDKNKIKCWPLKEPDQISEINILEKEHAIRAITISDRGNLFVATDTNHIYQLNAQHYFGEEDTNTLRTPFVEWAQLKNTTSNSLLQELQSCDWNRFSLDQDTVPLRNLLKTIYTKEGLQEVHYYCSDFILSKSKRLLHDYGHQGKVNDWSSNGKWTVSSTWLDHKDYDAGGSLMVWENQSKRCVNIIKAIEGGIGWDEHHSLEWKPNENLVGMAFNTNGIGTLNPFSYNGQMLMEAYVTNGYNRPPVYSFTKEGETMIINLDTHHLSLKVMEGKLGGEFARPLSQEETDLKSLLYNNDAPLDPDIEASIDYLDRIIEVELSEPEPVVDYPYPLKPAFPIECRGNWYWLLATENGLVYCPTALRPEAHKHLSFSVLNKYAWPVEWVGDRHIQYTETIDDFYQHQWFSNLTKDQ